MARLIEFDPKWIDHAGRRGLGLDMRAPLQPNVENESDRPVRLWVLFANPLDGGPAFPGNSRALILELVPILEDRCFIMGSGTTRWHRRGETFDTLSLSPSVNAYEHGHFTISNGGW